MTDNELRKQVKLLKAFDNISYKELSEYLDIKQDSLYSWLRGNYNFSYQRQARLKQIIETLKETEV